MHVAIAGNIGSGKTTLTGLLRKHYKWELITRMWTTILSNDFYRHATLVF